MFICFQFLIYVLVDFLFMKKKKYIYIYIYLFIYLLVLFFFISFTDCWIYFEGILGLIERAIRGSLGTL